MACGFESHLAHHVLGSCGRGVIGSHAGLRGLCQRWRRGSNPLDRTMSEWWKIQTHLANPLASQDVQVKTLSLTTLCGYGGSGRRAALRSLWARAREGSTPFTRTSSSALFQCGCGGSGRRAGFRYLWGRPQEGSTPFSRTSTLGVAPRLLGWRPEEASRVAPAKKPRASDGAAMVVA